MISRRKSGVIKITEKNKNELKEKVGKVVEKVKKGYDKLPDDKKTYLKYGAIALAGAVVGGVLGYLLGRQNK